MIAAEGILTSHGGKTSHAAVIARGMGAPCVCGADALRDRRRRRRRQPCAGTDVVIREGDMISIDGTTGTRWCCGAVELGACPRLDGRSRHHPVNWADEVSARLGVRANADNPEDAAAVPAAFGAEGIGLCRTEHMFLGDRKQIIQTFILNEDERRARAGRGAPVRGYRRATSTACSRPWTGCPSSCACSIRRCTSSWRAPARWTWRSRGWRPRAATRPSSPRSASSWSRSTP